MLYNWLLVLKNGNRYLVKDKRNDVESFITFLVPQNKNETRFTCLPLSVYVEGNSTVVINGSEISEVLLRGEPNAKVQS